MAAITEFVTVKVGDGGASSLSHSQGELSKQPGVLAQYSGGQEEDNSIAYWLIVWESMEKLKAYMRQFPLLL
jgi:hypothetical protein